MAYVNIKDWAVDQVVEWLKGLDSIVLQYTPAFLNNGIYGQQLLNLQPDDLENLGVHTISHQEIILEAVEHLRNCHFEISSENLQSLALRLSCAANSLYKELLLVDDNCSVVLTQTMADVHNAIRTIKLLVNWLDRSPFTGDKDYIDTKTQLLQLAFEMATSAHRDIFSEQPVKTIKKICEKLTKISDYIIQEISDPLILQTASLDLVTLKKKEQEIGFCLLPSNHCIHEITDVKYGSPAHASKKIEEGDEIIQVNYQTVVGWQQKKVLLLLHESPPEIVLTLKKRPKHTKIYGPIYMKPYRLPSRKIDNQPFSRWDDALLSTPTRILPLNNITSITVAKSPSIYSSTDVVDELSSSDSEPSDSPISTTERMYGLKPRPILQRRNTITGTTPSSTRQYASVEQFWLQWKHRATSTTSSSISINNTKFEKNSQILRDKSASCTLALDVCPRPSTVIGVTRNTDQLNQNLSTMGVEKPNLPTKRVNFNEKNNIIPELNLHTEKDPYHNASSSTESNDDNTEVGIEVDKKDDNVLSTGDTELDNQQNLEINVVAKDAALKEVHIHEIIKKFDDCKPVVKPKIVPRTQVKKPPSVPQKPDNGKKPAVPPRSATTKLRTVTESRKNTSSKDVTPISTVEGTKTMDIPHSPVVFNSDSFPKYELGIPIVDTSPKNEDASVSTNKSYNNILTKDSFPKTPSKPLRSDIYSPSPSYNDTRKFVFSSPPFDSNDISNSNSFSSFESSCLEASTSTTNTSKKNPKSKPPSAATSTASSNNSKSFESNDNDHKFMKTSRMGGSQSNYELQKINSDTKISPTNSIVRAMIYSNKNKCNKKKNALIAKRRNVSICELNPNDVQGILHQRIRNKQNQSVDWEKRWFVLFGNCLYGYKNVDDSRAACLIFLSGFTVAVATEVKSRQNAFKVYHTGTVFYFSTDDNTESFHIWMETISAATLSNESNRGSNSVLYSESDDDADDEDDGHEKVQKPTQKQKTTQESLRKFGSLKKFTSKKNTDSSRGSSTSLDRKWFFNKSSSTQSKSVPVPTAQFRSYRRIKPEEGTSITTGNFTSHVALFTTNSDLSAQPQNVSVPNLATDPIQVNRPLKKRQPIDYMHASNPSLCHASDYVPILDTLPINKPVKSYNLTGFVTLEELMIKQAEERRKNPYNIDDEDFSMNFHSITPDVVYGEVPFRHCSQKSDDIEEESSTGSSCFGKRLGSLKKSHKKSPTSDHHHYSSCDLRTVSKSDFVCGSAQDYEEDFVQDRSYEMIYCPQTVTDVQFAQNRNIDNIIHQNYTTKMSPDDDTMLHYDREFSSFKKPTKYSPSNPTQLKSATQYTPMCLPLSGEQNMRPHYSFELNLDDKSNKGNKLRNMFHKSNSSRKDKPMVSSPKLSRSIFGKSVPNTNNEPEFSISRGLSSNILDGETCSSNVRSHHLEDSDNKSQSGKLSKFSRPNSSTSKDQVPPKSSQGNFND